MLEFAQSRYSMKIIQPTLDKFYWVYSIFGWQIVNKCNHVISVFVCFECLNFEVYFKSKIRSSLKLKKNWSIYILDTSPIDWESLISTYQDWCWTKQPPIWFSVPCWNKNSFCFCFCFPFSICNTKRAILIWFSFFFYFMYVQIPKSNYVCAMLKNEN